jgi:transposase
MSGLIAYAQQFLGDWHGYLLVDDYGGYKALFAAARAHPVQPIG